MPLAIGATAPTIPSPAPSSDAAVSLATPIQAPAASAASVPIANAFTLATPAANEQSGSHLETAPGATAREAAPIALPLRPAPELPAAPLRPTSAPAAQVFAAAIHRALGEQDTRQSRDPAPVSAPLAPAIPGIAAAGAVQQGALDLRHEHWPAAMIERIVTLRDMAAENDTRLRLSPDMLGTIDVSLKRDGDQVQVQITAEQAQTRQLLAEAQPRLTELADARGVKLQLSGGNAGGAGQQPGPGNSSGGGDAPRQQAPATSFPTRPRSAEHGATDDTDQRIA
ncbi:flagellar hook-length control protein FliK [Sphingomonas palmae]|uniref:Flagellar hook-length control protein FliK n=2 Tax=Sphingomonas palmae TaxID=1855283 RepID=A0A1H7RJJ6_9SPHN|nr:flagellar hook-length control protein FliK [Sphingomonas palmae]